MKTLPLLLVVSLAANAALVGYLVLGPAPAPDSAPVAVAPGGGGAAGAAGPAASAQALRAALESGDAAALAAAGLSPELARELAAGRAFARLAARLRAAPAGDGRWWRNAPPNPAAREDQLAARRELSEALRAAFGDDAGLFTSAIEAASLAFLPAGKRDALRRIVADYDEMMAKFSAGGIQLPSDRERLRLLREERERDIAALLTPAEREAYEMRMSPTAATVRARYGEGLATEEDFRAVYALQKAFDEKFPADFAAGGRVTPEVMRQRADAQRQLADGIRTALGDEKFAALRRATDSDLRNVDSLASRLNLPAGTTDRVAAARDTLAAESQRINADTALTPAQRRAQIQALGAQAKAGLAQTLGQEAADAYARRSPWVGMLQNGMAYSTAPQPNSPGAFMPTGQSVYPVMPAGATGPGTPRQTVMINSGAVVSEAPAAGTLFLSDTVPVVSDNVQVMSFTSATHEAAAPVTPVAPPPPPATVAPLPVPEPKR